jgi:hypothetical protein
VCILGSLVIANKGLSLEAVREVKLAAAFVYIRRARERPSVRAMYYAAGYNVV